jgi:hypothetical protein
MDSIGSFVKNWADEFIQGDHTDEEKLYIKRCWPRYSFVLHRVNECIQKCNAVPKTKPLSILDIGPHYFTILLKKSFPDSIVNTFGYDYSEINWQSIRKDHFTFDLNSASLSDAWPTFPKHDIVVMGEVIEHLLIAPWMVLRFVKTLLKDHGFLILSTPNAVTIAKRIFLLLGRNPFEMLRENLRNPGHFREYTTRELIDSGSKAGLSVERKFLANYFILDNPKANAFFNSFGFIPTLRNGITIVYRISSR